MKTLIIPALENITSWHERDISHSSVERINAPTATITLDFALARMSNVINNLVVHKNNMRKNIEQLRGLTFSQNVLIFLTQQKISREDSYSIVQKCALATWNNHATDFKSELLKHPIIKKLNLNTEIKNIFNSNHLKKSTDHIFKRASK